MPSWVPLGDRAIRFARPPGVSAAAITQAVRGWPGVIDVVVAWEHVAAYFADVLDDVAREHVANGVAAEQVVVGAVADVNDSPTSSAQVAIDAAISALAGLPAEAEAGRDVELDAIYDGPDLDDVARTTGLTVDDVIARHAAAIYTVETMGFLPGFAYLRGLDPALEMPRRATPRTRVPAGALAIALTYTAVYPFETPGGWHLIGRVGEPMFGSDGARLRPGDRVRFRRRG